MDIGNIQSNKKYTINVVGTNKNNISTHQDIELAYSDSQIKEEGTYRYKVGNGKLIKEEKSDKYEGYMVSYPYVKTIGMTGNEITGEVVVQEWINGTKQKEPVTSPRIELRAEDGTVVSKITMVKKAFILLLK